MTRGHMIPKNLSSPLFRIEARKVPMIVSLHRCECLPHGRCWLPISGVDHPDILQQSYTTCSIQWGLTGYQGSHIQLACCRVANLPKQNSLEQRGRWCWSLLADLPCTACVKAWAGCSRQSDHKRVRTSSSCPHCHPRMWWQRKWRSVWSHLCPSGSPLAPSECSQTLSW